MEIDWQKSLENKIVLEEGEDQTTLERDSVKWYLERACMNGGEWKITATDW